MRYLNEVKGASIRYWSHLCDVGSNPIAVKLFIRAIYERTQKTTIKTVLSTTRDGFFFFLSYRKYHNAVEHFLLEFFPYLLLFTAKNNKRFQLLKSIILNEFDSLLKRQVIKYSRSYCHYFCVIKLKLNKKNIGLILCFSFFQNF
jgi:hypothetical protein